VTPTALEVRERALQALGGERFDALVIGGGINGAAIARDAALRGLRVALLERNDFASGTSSRSSRLIHGGLRYLEHGYLLLVFESSRERRLLLRLAPHLVRPLAFTWPVYQGARVPLWKLVAGLTLYDVLSLFRNVAPHRRLGRDGILAREPGLAREKLEGGATYYDAATDDARLTLANALGAEQAGATVLNHAPVREIVARGDQRFEVGIEDALTGRTFAARARVVVNATGPWTHSVQRLVEPAALTAVRGTKGVHITVPRHRVGNRNAITILSPIDGRVMFILPGGPNTIIGTTDTETSASPDDVRASEADVEYLVRSANGFFPNARLTRGDVIAAWAGIRPLIATGYTDGESSASREHALTWSASGMVSITGGKLTTYRPIAAQVVDAIEHRLGTHASPSATARVRLPGGDIASVDDEVAIAYAVVRDTAVAVRLVLAYGSAWRAVWRLGDRDRALREAIVDGLPYVMAEMIHAVERERALTLADLLIRRTHLAYDTPDNGRAAARRVAPVVAPSLEWSPSERDRQILMYDAEATRVFAIDPTDR
jgi:glycerol-3-phosphate dehydrogenase